MAHTSTASRQRSNNPRTRNAFFSTSPFVRKLPGVQAPNRPGGPRTVPTLQPPNLGGPGGGSVPPGLQFPGAPQPGGLVPFGGGGGGGGVPGTTGGGGGSIQAPPPGNLTSALGPGGPFLITSDNPFTQSRFGGQIGGGSNIPTIGESTPEGTDRQRLEDLRRFDRLGFAKEMDARRGITEEGTGKTAEASRLLAGALQNNPFISTEGLGQLQRGVAPLLNQIDPAFFRHTSPVIVKALVGLLQSFGIRPEDLAFQQQAARPEGF